MLFYCCANNIITLPILPLQTVLHSKTHITFSDFNFQLLLGKEQRGFFFRPVYVMLPACKPFFSITSLSSLKQDTSFGIGTELQKKDA